MKKYSLSFLFAIVPVIVLSGGDLVAGDGDSSPKQLVPLAAPFAEGDCLSYDFVDLEYGTTEFGAPYHSDGNTYGVGFSKSLGSTLFLTGAFADGGYDLNGYNKTAAVDTQRYRFGLGAHYDIGPCIDLTFEGGAEHLDAEFPVCNCLDYDSWGYYVGPGIRARAGRFEMFAKVLYTGREGDMSQQYLGYLTTANLATDETGWLGSAGVIYHLTDNIGVKVAAELGELDTAFTLGIRYEF